MSHWKDVRWLCERALVSKKRFVDAAFLTFMASSSLSRKRKRDADDAEKISLQIASASTSQVGPVLGENDDSFESFELHQHPDALIQYPFSFRFSHFPGRAAS